MRNNKVGMSAISKYECQSPPLVKISSDGEYLESKDIDAVIS